MQTKIKSVLQYPMVVYERVEHDISLGRIGGPSRFRPISNFGLVPKKTSGWSLITHLSYPPRNSVNDFIDEKLTTLQYSKFDNVTYIIQTLGEHVVIVKFILSQHIDVSPAILETLIYLVLK
jgi:hypothetical protein